MAKQNQPSIRNRIVERRRMDVALLAANEGNWREHPDAQRDALEGILEDVGQVGELYAYYSKRNRDALTLIDGHLRQSLGGEWDVAITDLDDAEADKLLLTYDPISALATANKAQLQALMQNVRTSNKHVATMLTNLAEREQINATQAVEPQSLSISDHFDILIQCESEQQQAALLQRFTDEGLKCRSLIA